MNKSEHLQQRQQIEKYLEQYSIYSLLRSVIEEVIVKKPEKPIDFMIEILSGPKMTFLIGPVGIKLYPLLKKSMQLMNSPQDVTHFNCGDFIKNHLYTKLTDKSKHYFNHFELIDDHQLCQGIIPKITQLYNNHSALIIEGFPKTLKQAYQIQKRGILPHKVIFVNIEVQRLQSIYKKLLREKLKDLDSQTAHDLLLSIYYQHQINTKALKQYYQPISFQINYTHWENQSYIIKQIQRTIALKAERLPPRKPYRIVIMGSPFSGRTSIGKQLATKYKLTYVSTSQLIAEQIRKDTVNGRKIADKYKQNKQIESYIIEKLLEERIQSTDCKMQGYILQGYPKSEEQWRNLKNLKQPPKFFIAIDSTMQNIKQRTEFTPNIQQRYQRWRLFCTKLQSYQQKILWIDPNLNLLNAFQEICFEIERRPS